MKTYLLRPSSAASWVKCHASAGLRARYPEIDGSAAKEGSASHDIAKAMQLGQQYLQFGQMHSNGVIITQPIIDGAREYCNYVAAWQTPVYIEQPLTMPDIHEECGGTPDTWGYDPTQRLIRLFDYKFGFEPVEVFENWQLICYASGIVTFLGLNGHDDQNIDIEFVIVQPRAPHREGTVRTWRTRLSNLRGYFNTLRLAAEYAMSANPFATVGNQCRYCSARHACDVLQTSAFVGVEMSTLPEPLDLSTFQASKELVQLEEAMSVLHARVTGLSAQIEHAMTTRGDMAPYHAIERARTRERWADGMEPQVIALGRLYGKELAKPVAAITPAQARALFIDESVIKAYSFKPIGENKLVRLDTKSTRKLFGENAL